MGDGGIWRGIGSFKAEISVVVRKGNLLPLSFVSLFCFKTMLPSLLSYSCHSPLPAFAFQASGNPPWACEDRGNSHFSFSLFPRISFGYFNLSIVTLERCSEGEALTNAIKIRNGFKPPENIAAQGNTKSYELFSLAQGEILNGS